MCIGVCVHRCIGVDMCVCIGVYVHIHVLLRNGSNAVVVEAVVIKECMGHMVTVCVCRHAFCYICTTTLLCACSVILQTSNNQTILPRDEL